MADRVAYDAGTMGQAGDALRQLAGYIIGELEELKRQAVEWERTSSGATFSAAFSVKQALEQEQHKISAISSQFGGTTTESGIQMAQLDRSLASNIG